MGMKDELDFLIKIKYHDTGTLFCRKFVIPFKTYSLKPLGKKLGYKFKTQIEDGAEATMEYERCVANKSKIPMRLVNYCKDDVKCMIFLLDFFKNNKFNDAAAL